MLNGQRSPFCCDAGHQDLKHDTYPWNTAGRVPYSTEKDNPEDKKRRQEEEEEEEEEEVQILSIFFKLAFCPTCSML